MAEPGQWWKDPLSQDIHNMLRVKEKKIPTYYGLSPHIFSRTFLVDWLAIIREKLDIQQTTYHLAVHLLDYYMEGVFDLKYSQLHLAALTCLTIAAKIEERCDQVPGVEVLNSFIPPPMKPGLPSFYHKSEFLEMELAILNFFRWNVIKPTTAHFVPYYISSCVAPGDLYDGIPIQSTEAVTLYVNNYADYFKDISLQYHMFRNYSPSMVGASCIAASRVCLQLTPTWPARLDTLTEYCLEELLPCVHALLRIHDKDLKGGSRKTP